MTYKITIHPSNQVIEIDEKTNILHCLQKEGIEIQSSCQGVASCGDCKIKVVAGEEHLSSMANAEEALLGNVFFITKERLACQTTLSGDVTIEILES